MYRLDYHFCFSSTCILFVCFSLTVQCKVTHLTPFLFFFITVILVSSIQNNDSVFQIIHRTRVFKNVFLRLLRSSFT